MAPPPFGDVKLRCGSGGKCEAAAGAAKHQFFRHLLIGEIDKVLAAAMHRHHMFEVEGLKFGHNCAKVVVRQPYGGSRLRQGGSDGSTVDGCPDKLIA